MTDIVERLRARQVTNWVHATGQTPRASGKRTDPLCAAAADEIERLRADVAVLKAENAHARDCLNSATTLLTGIHSLMYPPEITTADGRVMVFRPKSIDPHEILQGLSDRIRALPDELAALAARKGEA